MSPRADASMTAAIDSTPKGHVYVVAGGTTSSCWNSLAFSSAIIQPSQKCDACVALLSACELIAEQKVSIGLNTGARGTRSNQLEVRSRSGTEPPTLAEAGLDKKLSARAPWVVCVTIRAWFARALHWAERGDSMGAVFVSTRSTVICTNVRKPRAFSVI